MTDRDRSRSRVLVVHFGLFGDEPGGMNQVVNEYLTWDFPSVEIAGQLTTRRRRDAASIPLLFLAVAKVLVLALGRRPVVAVFHLSEGGSFIREGGLLRLARLLGLPTVAHLHGADFVDFSHRRSSLVGAVLRASSLVASLTPQSLERAATLRGSTQGVVEIPNAVSPPGASREKQPIVLFCGQVSRRKGFDVLADAWTQLSPEIREGWTLHVVGPLHSDCAGIEPPSSIMHGALPHNEALALQSSAAVACLPSRAEALPMFLLEAMIRECAVVGSDVGRVSELLSGHAGLIVTPGDIGELTSTLEKVLEDETLRRALGQQARARVEESFSGAKVQEDIVRLWLRALTG